MITNEKEINNISVFMINSHNLEAECAALFDSTKFSRIKILIRVCFYL